jgi:hypothetical protein
MYAQSDNRSGLFGNEDDAIFTNLTVQIGNHECVDLKRFSQEVSICTTANFTLTDRTADSVPAVFKRQGAVSSFPIAVRGAPAPVIRVMAMLQCSPSCCGSVLLSWLKVNNHGSAIVSYTVTAHPVGGSGGDDVAIQLSSGDLDST